MQCRNCVMKVSFSLIFFLVTVFSSCLLWQVLIHPKLKNYKLVIGILSAREHFILRDVIRSTWLSVINTPKLSNNVIVKFLLTNQDCDIPKEYRKSVYSCDETRPIDLGLKGSVDILRHVNAEHLSFDDYTPDFVTVGFDFSIIFDVVLSGFSVPAWSGRNTVVQLWNLASDTLVIQSNKFHLEGNTYVFKIHPHILPKGFVGSIIVICDNNQPCSGIKNWFHDDVFHPAIEISHFIRYTMDEGEFPIHILPVKLQNMLLPASLVLEFSDIQQLENYTYIKETAFTEGSRLVQEIEHSLSVEMQNSNDILLLPDVGGGKLQETYRNIPRKLISFHQWVLQNLNVDFIMKTDDDSYVDIEKIVHLLQQFEQSDHSSLGIWLGNFRRDWIVDRWGKWAEHQYSSSVYPAYACGAGNIISSNISKYLARNSENLKFYQGEDISMGIWMSGLDTEYVQDDMWLCDDTCDSEMAVSTQHSASSLKHLWRNKIDCGNPCGCK